MTLPPKQRERLEARLDQALLDDSRARMEFERDPSTVNVDAETVEELDPVEPKEQA
jgi:hypothetical protein